MLSLGHQMKAFILLFLVSFVLIAQTKDLLVLIQTNPSLSHCGSDSPPINTVIYSALNGSEINLSSMVFRVLRSTDFLLDFQLYYSSNGSYTDVQCFQQKLNGSTIGVMGFYFTETDQENQLARQAKIVHFEAGEYIYFLYGATCTASIELLPIYTHIVLQEQ